MFLESGEHNMKNIPISLTLRVNTPVLLKNEKFPLREYVHPAKGCTKYMWLIQYRTPPNMNRRG